MIYWGIHFFQGFPSGSVVKNPPANAGDAGLIPGSGRSPGEGNGNPLQYSCLENPMGRGVLWATVPGVSRSQTRHSNSSNRLHLSHPLPQCTDCFFPLVLLWDLSGHFLLMERQSNDKRKKNKLFLELVQSLSRFSLFPPLPQRGGGKALIQNTHFPEWVLIKDRTLGLVFFFSFKRT